jgi:hypothetical protein
MPSADDSTIESRRAELIDLSRAPLLFDHVKIA